MATLNTILPTNAAFATASGTTLAGAMQSGHCRHCGTALPDWDAPPLEELIGQEHAKRAIEVALAGGHSICFEGIGNAAQAVAFARRSAALGLTAFAIIPCPCGNHGDAELACVCKPAMIARYQARPNYRVALLADIHVELPRPNMDKIRAFLGGRRGEPEVSIRARVAEARERQAPPPAELPSDTRRLLEAAVRQLRMDELAIRHVLSLGATIGRLAGSDSIRPAHLAEAIQYRRRGPALVEGLSE